MEFFLLTRFDWLYFFTSCSVFGNSNSMSSTSHHADNKHQNKMNRTDRGGGSFDSRSGISSPPSSVLSNNHRSINNSASSSSSSSSSAEFFAVKLVKPQREGSCEVVTSLSTLREIKLLRELKHENVVIIMLIVFYLHYYIHSRWLYLCFQC